MKPVTRFKLIYGMLTLLAIAGCESTGGSGGGNVSSGTNYGTGMNEPRPPDPVIIVEPTTGAGPRGGGR